MPLLTDGAVSLRAWRQSDVPALVRTCNDAELERWTNLPFPYTEEVGHGWIAAIHARPPEARHWNFAITDATSGRLTGSITVRDVDLNGQIGYWVAREARGRGVATRALVLLSRWALAGAGYPRVQLLTHPENRASQRVADSGGSHVKPCSGPTSR